MPRRVLTQKQRYEVINFVKEHYTEKALSDREFAAWATGQLGYLVDYNNVESSRDVLDIAATKFATGNNGGTEILLGRIKALEDRVTNLDKQVEAIKELLALVQVSVAKPIQQQERRGM